MTKAKSKKGNQKPAAGTVKPAPQLVTDLGELFDLVFEQGKRGARPEVRGCRVVLVPTWYLLPDGERLLGGGAALHATLYDSITDGHFIELGPKTTRTQLEDAVVVADDEETELEAASYRGLRVPEG